MVTVRISSSPASRPSDSRAPARRRGAEPVGPFDDADRPVERLGQPELDELARPAEPVEVGVPELDRAEVVDLDQRVGRRRDRLVAAERREPRANQRPGEDALAGAEVADEADEIAGAETRRDRVRQAFGVARAAKRQGSGQVGSDPAGLVAGGSTTPAGGRKPVAQARSAGGGGDRQLGGQDEARARRDDAQLAAVRRDDAPGEPEADAFGPLPGSAWVRTIRRRTPASPSISSAIRASGVATSAAARPRAIAARRNAGLQPAASAGASSGWPRAASAPASGSSPSPRSAPCRRQGGQARARASSCAAPARRRAPGGPRVPPAPRRASAAAPRPARAAPRRPASRTGRRAASPTGRSRKATRAEASGSGATSMSTARPSGWRGVGPAGPGVGAGGDLGQPRPGAGRGAALGPEGLIAATPGPSSRSIGSRPHSASKAEVTKIRVPEA